jgi:hypothetical protein
VCRGDDAKVTRKAATAAFRQVWRQNWKELAAELQKLREGPAVSIQNDSGLPHGPAGTFRSNLSVR